MCSIILAYLFTTASPLLAASHPLDPLTASEMKVAVEVLRAAKRVPEGTFIPLIVTREPSKAEVLALKPGATLARRALAQVFDRVNNRTFEAVVRLDTRQIESWTDKGSVQPLVLMGEYEEIPKLVRQNAAFIAALERRGITNPADVQIDVWAAGSVDTNRRGARWLRGLVFQRGRNWNSYARPVEGLQVLVDANQMIIEVIDTGVVPVSQETQDFDAAHIKSRRPKLKPLKTQAPSGPSFVLEGNSLTWDRWRLHYALHPREGLIIYAVGWDDNGRFRPVLYRGSVSEMVVPYGDSDPNWTWRSAFDEGEYGLGRLVESLDPEKDAPANAVFADAVLHDDLGAPQVVKRAIAIYERDGGMLWKYLDIYTGHVETRRARELVVTAVFAVSNYDYGLSWIFRQDGSLTFESTATGILLAKGVDDTACAACPELAKGESPTLAQGSQRYATLVAPNLVAPNHQHFFNLRLDLDVDGPTNGVVEMNSEAVPMGPANPAGNAFFARETILARESAAQRDLEAASHRMWAVYNTGERTALGHLPAYLIEPGPSNLAYLAKNAPVRQRARFLDHALWVTREKDGEMHAAGEYPNLSRGGDGLPQFAADDESLVGEDVVLWYTFGLHHLPRPEDWPVMPVARTGITLMPRAFFTQSPALDVH